MSEPDFHNMDTFQNMENAPQNGYVFQNMESFQNMETHHEQRKKVTITPRKGSTMKGGKLYPAIMEAIRETGKAHGIKPQSIEILMVIYSTGGCKALAIAKSSRGINKHGERIKDLMKAGYICRAHYFYYLTPLGCQFIDDYLKNLREAKKYFEGIAHKRP